MVAHMGPGAEFAIKEVNDSGQLARRRFRDRVRGDSTCIDAGAAVAVAERQVTSDGVKGIVGGDCSGVTGAMLANVALPNGIVMISPSATSPALSTAEDNGLFFRTSPSDARQGVVMTEILKDLGINEVALTYTNNDYGKGLADSFQEAYEAAGGRVTINAAHEDGKAITQPKSALWQPQAASALLLQAMSTKAGRASCGPRSIQAPSTRFIFPDGMISENLLKNFGSESMARPASTHPAREAGQALHQSGWRRIRCDLAIHAGKL